LTDTASSEARLYGSEAFAVPTRTVNAAAEPDGNAETKLDAQDDEVHVAGPKKT
jgi:hypothetical protein